MHGLSSVLIRILVASFLSTLVAPYHAHAICDPAPSTPKVHITSATLAGGFYSDNFKISGRIRGCGIEDVTIYVNNDKVQSIPLTYRRKGGTQSYFNVTIDASLEPEIRILHSSGKVLIEKINVLDQRG